MSRTIKEIYNEAVQERNRRLELTEFASDSKLSVMNGILWTVAAVIYSFETLLDVFAVDISEAINNRINGTPDYYANALLQYQQGDELTVREDGLAFGYAQVDETKRIITQVSYVESTDDSNLDSKLVLKIATGTKGHLEAIPAEELVPIKGLMPDPMNLPQGCTFAERCPYATDACRQAVPELRPVRGTHFVACAAYDDPNFRLRRNQNG